jgi:ELWxxDGT repeat protein
MIRPAVIFHPSIPSIVLLIACALVLTAAPLGAQTGLEGTGVGQPAWFRFLQTDIVTLGDSAYFFAADSGGEGLWRSDGTAAGTGLVKSIMNGFSLREANRRLFFTTSSGSPFSGGPGYNTVTLWTSDGTAVGTKELLSGIAPYYVSTVPQGIRQPNPGFVDYDLIGSGNVFLIHKVETGLDGASPRHELWSYTPGSAQPALIYGFTGDNSLIFSAACQGALFFTIEGQLWTSDGVTVSRLVESINAELYSYAPARDAVNKGTRYFVGHDEAHGGELWKSTPAGNVLVMDIAPGVADSMVRAITAFRNGVVFIAGGAELWYSDGTDKGTMRLTPSVNSPWQIFAGIPWIDGRYLFSYKSDAAGYEPWITDGTEAGSARLKDINPGLPDSDPGLFAACGSRCYFTADDGVHGRVLWKSDGTAAGTVMVDNLQAMPAGAQIAGLAGTETKVFFFADYNRDQGRTGAGNAYSPPNARQLWCVDGAGAMLVKQWYYEETMKSPGDETQPKPDIDGHQYEIPLTPRP